MIGIFSKTTDSSIIESVTLSGLDFIIIDQEHGPVSRERLFDHIRAVSNDSLAIVRVAELNHNLIGAAYDAGAHGVQVPNISSVEEAKSAIEAARFYPKGMRGVCRFVKAASYGSMDKVDFFKNENEKLLILQVEGTKGIENIDAILSLDGFDILFIGPYDLSQSLGIPGQIQHHLVQDNIIKIVQKAKAKNIKVGTFVDTFEDLTNMKKLGIDYIAFSVDVNIFYNACKSIINQYVEN